MTEQGRKVIHIRACPKCGNHIGFHATADEAYIYRYPHAAPGVPLPHRVRIDAAGVTCLKCNTLLLPTSEIPCAASTKSPVDGEIEGD